MLFSVVFFRTATLRLHCLHLLNRVLSTTFVRLIRCSFGRCLHRLQLRHFIINSIQFVFVCVTCTCCVCDVYLLFVWRVLVVCVRRTNRRRSSGPSCWWSRVPCGAASWTSPWRRVCPRTCTAATPWPTERCAWCKESSAELTAARYQTAARRASKEVRKFLKNDAFFC